MSFKSLTEKDRAELLAHTRSITASMGGIEKAVKLKWMLEELSADQHAGFLSHLGKHPREATTLIKCAVVGLIAMQIAEDTKP